MRSLPNFMLTTNFSRFEVIEGTNLSRLAIELNWKNIKEYDEVRFTKLLLQMEVVRSLINILYISDIDKNKEIGLRITSGFRCKEWELIRGRSGLGQHPLGAVDIQPTNCGNSQAITIMKHLYNIFWPRQNGFRGGFAIAEPTYKDGRIEKIGFLHFDNRNEIARWIY